VGRAVGDERLVTSFVSRRCSRVSSAVTDNAAIVQTDYIYDPLVKQPLREHLTRVPISTVEERTMVQSYIITAQGIIILSCNGL
jgi:hypothetical protein